MSSIDFEIGTIRLDGTNLSNNYCIRTSTAIKLPANAVISISGQYKMYIAEYSSFDSSTSFTFIQKSGWITDDYTVSTDCYVRISITAIDDNTKFADNAAAIADAAASLNIAYQESSNSGGLNIAETGISRTILPYSGYTLQSTTSNEATAPSSGNLASLYEKWDALVTAYPNNVSMEVLGTASSYEIRCYTITSNSDQFKWVDSHSLTPQTNLKILWLSGIHGHESTVFVDDLKFFTELLKQDNEVTARLMDNCVFKVIPAICPWGYNNGSRINANGVNINRNFKASWKLSGESTNDYSGASAMSEEETQIVAQFLKDNSDCYMAINRHSSSEFTPTSVLGFFVSQFEVDRKLAYNMCRFMSNQIKRSNLYSYITGADNSDANSRCLQTVETSTATGTLDKYFNSLGIHGYLYEASPSNKVTSTDGDGYYGEDWGREIWQRINVTNIGNLLYALMLQNEYFYD